MDLISFFSFLLLSPIGASADSLCNEICGDLSLSYPFHLNSSCGPQIDAFRLTCSSNSTLYLTLGTTDLRIIAFLAPNSILLDYSSNSNSSLCDRWYADINSSSRVFHRSPFFAVTPDNLLRLYDCDDSSVCRSGCEKAGGCDGEGCCYPLSDGSVWKEGVGFGVFAEFGCRGFSSWVEKRALPGVWERGIEVEWAVPRMLAAHAPCARGALMLNSSVVNEAYSCACGPQLVGDGFARGIGCFQDCLERGMVAACSDGRHSGKDNCCKERLSKKKVAILVGVLISAIFIAGALAIYLLIKFPVKRGRKKSSQQACLPRILGRASRARLFTYQELNDATKGFNHEQQLISMVDGNIHLGVIDDGSLVAIQKVNCENESNHRQVWNIIDILSQASHKNIARIMGCCISSDYSLLVVHEFFSHGTLEEHLQRRRGHGLSWSHRLSIAVEVARALSFLRSEIYPPVNLHALKSSEIFIDAGFSAKIASFKFLSSNAADECCYRDTPIAYNFGVILLELVTGSTKEHVSELALSKIKDRRLHEIVDPYLEFSKQRPAQCQQMERTAFFAAQCLAARVGDNVSMVRIAQDFIRIALLRENAAAAAGDGIFELELEPSSDDFHVARLLSCAGHDGLTSVS